MFTTSVGFSRDKPLDWYYDTKRHKMYFHETEQQQALRAQREAQAQKTKKEREYWDSVRRKRKKLDEKILQEKRDKARRTNTLQGRIAHLRTEISFDKNNNAARAELSMAKTQLFWLENAL